VDARDDTFRLAEPADLVAAMYLLVYAQTAIDLGRMVRLIARNLIPGGRFVTYTLHPDFDLTQPAPRLLEQFGFDIQPTGAGRADLVIGDLRVGLYQWSRAEHEARLEAAGLTDVRWHPLALPPGDPELARSLAWCLERPHCVVLSAAKP